MVNNGSRQPSMHEKIFWQSSLISRLSPDLLYNWSCGLTTGTGSHVNVGFLQSPYQKLTSLRSSIGLPHFSPLFPVFMKPHSEKGANNLDFPVTTAGFNPESTIMSQLIIAPIYRVKLLLQTENELLKTGRLSRPYTGICDCFSRTIKNEGFLNLWRGTSARIIRFCIFEQEYSRRVYDSANKDKDCYWKWFSWNVAAIGASSFESLLFSYSLDYAHTRLATDIKDFRKGVSERQFDGLINVYEKTLMKSDACLYRGFTMACVGFAIAHAALYSITDSRNPVVPHGGSRQGNGHVANIDLVNSLGLFLVCYPFDTVSKRMMMTSTYKNPFDAFNQIVKFEGPKSLFKGAGAIIFSLAVFLVFPVF